MDGIKTKTDVADDNYELSSIETREEPTDISLYGGQRVGHNLIKNIGSHIKSTLLYYKKRLSDSLVNNTERVPFKIGARGIKQVNKMYLTPVAPKEKLKYITSGSFNSIYTTADNKYAYRITTDAINANSEEAQELVLEMLLTVRLSKLGISPKIVDIFFAKNDMRSGNNTHAVMITEFSKYGSLSNFMKLEECTLHRIPELVSQTTELYKKMIKNKVFCTDVKPGNMLVTKSYRLYLIDFDDQFCASKESSIFTGEHIYLYAQQLAKLWRPENKHSEEIVNKGFLGLNLLQTGVCMLIDNIKNEEKFYEYARRLVTNNIAFTKEELGSIVLCSYIPVSADYNPYMILKHYLIGMDPPYTFAGFEISDDPVTIIITSYLLCALGEADTVLILRTMSEKDDIIKVADRGKFPVFSPTKYWDDKKKPKNIKDKKQEMIDELRKKHAQKKPKTIKNKNQKIIEQLTKQLAQMKAK